MHEVCFTDFGCYSRSPSTETVQDCGFRVYFFTIRGPIDSKLAIYKQTIALYNVGNLQGDSFKTELINASGRLRDVAG